MLKLTEVFAQHPRTFSFEVFPPRGADNLEPIFDIVAGLAPMQPDFVSGTYTPGGASREATRQIVGEIQRRFGFTGMHHLTHVNQTRDDLAAIIAQMKADGIRNILALRGDPPADWGGKFHHIEGGFAFTHEFVEFIRKTGGDAFSVGVAGYPEKHPEAPTLEADTEYLKAKIDHGGEFVLTQFFFENESYSKYLERTSRAGVNVRIIPGVLPITDYDKLVKFADRCGAYICPLVHDTFEPLRGDREATARQGVEYAIKQCEDLLRRGAPGLHFYCLNQIEPVLTIWRQVRERAVWKRSSQE